MTPHNPRSVVIVGASAAGLSVAEDCVAPDTPAG